jgi:hypothetical protein
VGEEAAAYLLESKGLKNIASVPEPPFFELLRFMIMDKK